MSEDGVHESHTPHNSNMVRNIVTGAITTIIGATFVYFLNHSGQNNDSSSTNYLEVKEATTKAWKTYVALENLEYKNTMLLAAHYKDMNGIDEFKEQLTKESNKFDDDMGDLLKTKNLDDAFSSLLKRRLDAEKEAMQKWNSFFTNYANIINTTQAGQEQTDKINAEYKKVQTSGELIVEKTKTEITDLSKSLAEKYGQPFAVTDLLLFQDDKKKQETTADNNNNTNTGVQGNENNPALTNNNTNNNNPSDNTVNNYNKTNTTNTNYTNGPQVNARNLVGEWDTPGAVITLSSNGQMIWEMNTGQNTSGTWQFQNNQLYMTYPNQYGVTGTFIFNLYNVTANSFTMVLTTTPYYRYDLTRYNNSY